MVIAYTQLANGDASFTPANDGVWDNTIDTDDFGLGIPKPCVLEILLENNNAGNAYELGVRELGSGLARLFDIHEAEAGGDTHMTLLVQTDADGLFEAYSEDVSRTTHHIVGYFTGVTYTEKFNTWYALLADPQNAWKDKDLFTDYSVPKERVCEVICAHSLGASAFGCGVRINGSAIARVITLQEAEPDGENGYSTFVKTDADGKIEYWVATPGNNTIQIYILLGYFDSAVDFTEEHTTYSPGADATWTQVDIIACMADADVVAAFICMNGEDGAENELGVRDDGTAIDRKWNEHEAEGILSGYNGFRLTTNLDWSDPNENVEIYEEDDSECETYFHGWFHEVSAGPSGWTQLQYSTEPPTTSAWNKLKYISEPPTPNAWNKLAYENE